MPAPRDELCQDHSAATPSLNLRPLASQSATFIRGTRSNRDDRRRRPFVNKAPPSKQISRNVGYAHYPREYRVGTEAMWAFAQIGLSRYLVHTHTYTHTEHARLETLSVSLANGFGPCHPAEAIPTVTNLTKTGLMLYLIVLRD